MGDEQKRRALEFIRHLSALTGADGCFADAAQKAPDYAEEGHFCAGCAHPRCEARNTFLYGVSEARRWGGKYIYYCPLGLMFAAAALPSRDARVMRGIVAGPIVLGDMQDTLSELADPAMTEKVAALPVMEPPMATHLASVLAAGTGADEEESSRQEQLLNAIYTAQDRLGGVSESYPFEYEKQLRQMILSRDKSGAQRLLNELLGHIYCAGDFDIERIRPRIIELIVILSRATIDAGADSREIFLYNDTYLKEVERFTTIEAMSLWITDIMRRFIEQAFDFAQAHHSDVVYKAMEYIRRNYDRKLTLDEIAQHVYLSRSYLSSLFREEAGQTLFSYLNQVRIEKSKLYLLDPSISLVDITLRCGFEDQSYFTRVFKKATGVSPKKYRSCRGNLEILEK